ncbi:MAG: hypothetical protein M3Q74_06045 [Pseudomonadota bacterium]|nr:hypothetical protein [Pseudomonadota bacterium]
MITVAAAILSRPLMFQDAFLDSLAALSLGAVFGSTATANGVKTQERADRAAAVVVATAADVAANVAATAAGAASGPYAAETAHNTELIAKNTDPANGGNGGGRSTDAP